MSKNNVNVFPLMIMSVLIVISGIFCLANGAATALGHAFFGGRDIALLAQALTENVSGAPEIAETASIIGIALAVVGVFQLWAGIAGIMASQNAPRHYRVVTVLGVTGAIMSAIAILALFIFHFSFEVVVATMLIGMLPWLYLYTAARAGRRRI